MANRDLTFTLIGNDKSAGKTFDTLGSKMKTGLVAGAAAAGLALIAFGKSSVDAFKESEDAQTRLSDAFTKFPSLADTSLSSLQKLNTELAKKTTFDDDATASGQAVLAQFKLTGEQVKQLTPLLQDYAAKTGKDLPSAAQDLGKAMLGQGRALKAIGLNFKDTGTAAGNFDSLMGGLSAQVGGFAEKEGKTAAGQAQIMSNQFGELEEKVGSKLVPAMTAFASAGLKVIDFISRNSAVLGPLLAALGGLVAVVWAIGAATRAWAAIQLAFNVIMAANPIVLIGAALALLVGGLILAYNKSETFRDIVNAAFEAVGTVVSTVVNAISTVVTTVFDAIGTYFDTIFSVFSTIFGTAWDALKALVTTPVGAIQIAVSTVFDAIKTYFDTIFKTFSTIFGTVWDGLKKLVTDPVGAIKTAVEETFNGVKSFFSTVFGAIGELFSTAWSGFKTLVSTPLTAIKDFVTGTFGSIVQFVTGLPGKIASAASGMFDGIKEAFRSAINWIIRAWNHLEFRVPDFDTHIPGVGKVGGFTLGVPDIDEFSAGGTVPGPKGVARPAIVHGGELVLNPSQQAALYAGGGGGDVYVTVNVEGSVTSEGQLVDKIHSALLRKQQRSPLGFAT